jgi:hypothetical protein
MNRDITSEKEKIQNRKKSKEKEQYTLNKLLHRTDDSMFLFSNFLQEQQSTKSYLPRKEASKKLEKDRKTEKNAPQEPTSLFILEYQFNYS